MRTTALLLLMVGMAALSIAGCSAHSSTVLRDGSGAGQVIYRVSEETAFTTALEAYAALFPKKSVDDIDVGTTRTNERGPVTGGTIAC
jgi:hypothetical protein